MECYWALFQATGAPVFYLLYRQERQAALQARSAWGERQAAV